MIRNSETEGPRSDGRRPDQLRSARIQRHYTGSAPGSVLVQAGRTTVLCTASIEDSLPAWKEAADAESGWITAEYSMLPGSTRPRKARERGRIEGRTSEIQRLIGRSLRAVVDLAALGPRTIVVDCDVLEADGGTRTWSITGGFVALVDAVAELKGQLDPARPVFRDSVASISVGVVDGRPLLDLDYSEDSRAEVDMNVVMTGRGRFVEIQGTAEGHPFGREMLLELLSLAEAGIAQLTELQRAVLGGQWPLDS